MNVEYLACGNIMSDRIENEDSTHSDWHMGGPAFFALTGIRLWTKSCKLVCQTGEDYADTYGAWMDVHGVSRESVRVEMEHTTRFTLKYEPDGNGRFIPKPHFTQEHLGYLKTHPEEIEAACAPGIKGMYMAQNTDRVFWEKLEKIKAKYGFKIMWEVEYGGLAMTRDFSRADLLERIRRVLTVADMWSINHNEASDLFGIDRADDEAIIGRLQQLPTALTFYRVGDRGAYAVTPTNAYFCESLDLFGPSVDPTGCGNNSTGAAMYAAVSGEHPAMVAVMANISAGFNAAQHGPYRLYTQESMDHARALAAEYFARMKKEHKIE